MKNLVVNSEDNEFMGAGLQSAKMVGSRSISTEQIINKLQEKNITLQSQVKKIQRVLSSMKVQQKPRYGIILPQIKPDTIKKQLQNAYKQIKIYEHEIQRRRSALSGESAYVEQVNKIEKVYKEKVEIHEKLKREMLSLKHESKQLIKQLKNNVKKQEYLTLENKLTTDIKYHKQKMRDYELKRAANIVQLQKQREMIKDMEALFLKQNPNQALEALKAKIFTQNTLEQSTILTPSRSIVDIENQAAKQQSRVLKIKQQLEETDDMSPYAFMALQGDAKLLRKMRSDYETKINFLIKERDDASQKNFKSRNKLLEVEFEIETIQKNIAQLKKLIDPSIFKPKLLKSDDKTKIPTKSKASFIPHSFKFVDSGQITKNGKRFSDRAVIGKMDSKITAITLYQREQTGEFVGLQATYKLDDQKNSIKKGNINTRLDMKKQAYKQESLRLQGQDYLRTVDLFMNRKKIVGISVVSWKNKILRAGDCSGQRIPLGMKESQYPMCFFGSILTDGFECLGVEIFEVEDQKETQNY